MLFSIEVDSIQEGSDSKPVWNKKNLATKTKYYDYKINTDFNDNRIPNKVSHCIYWSVLFIVSVL